MEKPKDYELKDWLYRNTIVGLEIDYYPVGVDSASTDWILKTSGGKVKKVRDSKIKPLVILEPDWARVLRLNVRYEQEVVEYKKFAKAHAKEIKEYERLKKKFG